MVKQATGHSEQSGTNLEQVSDFPVPDLTTPHPKRVEKRARSPEGTTITIPSPARKKAKSPGKAVKNRRYHANTKFLETVNARFLEIMPEEENEFEAAMALTTLASMGAHLSPAVDCESVRSAGVDIVEVVTDRHNGAGSKDLGPDDDSDKWDPYSEDNAEDEVELVVDSQCVAKHTDGHLPLEEIAITDNLSNAEESAATMTGVCARRNLGFSGTCARAQNMSSNPSLRQATRPCFVTLPLPSDDDDPMVRDVRKRVAQQDKLRKAEEALSKNKEVVTTKQTTKQGEERILHYRYGVSFIFVSHPHSSAKDPW